MRRSILLALVAALALAIGLNTAASAGVGAGAEATAKKKAAKKNCGKKKAGKSAAEGSAAAKKKAACKPKKKAKKKPAGAKLSDGRYKDAPKSLLITISGNGTQANVSGISSKCSGGIGIQVQGPIAPNGSTVKGTNTTSLFGGAGSVKWTLSITPSNLSYQLDTVWTVQFPEQDPCQDSKSLSGTLEK